MKFIQLEILNLASLDKQGGEVINFEEGALGESTIFSIVGPTGSGKSTLLDAICLALYDRAPRYPRKKGDRNQNIEIYGSIDAKENNRLAPTDNRNILTHGKKEGYSKLTFLANNGCLYRAEWHVRFQRVRYENAVTALYKISNSNGKVTEEVMDWKTLPTIIGLDYEQFLRTVLIAQGSFANFLTAKENERYELLEKLIGCEETYTRIATEIKKKKDEAVEAYNQINASVEAVKQNLLSDEDLTLLKEEIRQLENAEKEVRTILQQIEKQLQWYEEDDKQVSQLNLLQTQLDSAKCELERIQAQMLRLQLHDEIQPAVSLLRDKVSYEKNLEDGKKKIAGIEQMLQSSESNYLKESQKLTELKEAFSSLQDKTEEMAPLISQAKELKTQISSLSPTVSEKQKAMELALEESKKADKTIQESQKNIDKGKLLVAESEQKLAKMQKAIEAKKQTLADAIQDTEKQLVSERKKIEGQNIETLQQEKASADQKYQDAKSALQIVEHLDNAIQEKTDNQASQEKLSARNQKIDEALNKLDLNDREKEVETLRKSYTLMSSQDWQLHRTLLVAGSPCPLCGSTSHPYHDNQEMVKEATSELFQLLKNKEIRLKQQQEEEKRLIGEKKTNEGEMKTLKKRLTILLQEIEQYETAWQNLVSLYPKIPKSQNQLAPLLPIYISKQEEAANALSSYNQVQKELNRLTQVKDKTREAQNLYEKESNETLARLQEQSTLAKTKLAEYQALAPTLLMQKESKDEAYSQAKSIYDKAEQELKELQAKKQRLLKGEEPEVVEVRLQKQLKDANLAIDKETEHLHELSTQIANIKGALQTKKSQQDQTEKEKLAKSKELEEWILRYNQQKEVLITWQDVEDILYSSEDWNAIRHDKDEKTQALTKARALYQEALRVHQEHQGLKPTRTQEELRVDKEECQSHSQQNELIAAQARLRNHEDALKQLGDKAEILKQKTQDKEDWTAITDAIGTDGKTLRKIAQCYTLSFLIEHANEEIRKFNNRYELMQVKNSLGIRVIDHDRADDIRDTTSLSGGETFIVSLGLALGLSALSSRNISFENLFIDEGFGTLDPDTLATVIDSLAMLQTSQGKKVGIISHTSTMSERITTQIRIIKNGNSGSSHIEIYP